MATNSFERFVAQAATLNETYPGSTIEVRRAAASGGFRIWSIDLNDGFSVEVEWQNGRGFGVCAGTEFDFGQGVDEVYDGQQAVFERVSALLATRTPTVADCPVSVAELRRVRGRLQRDVAASLGITKGRLAQFEAKAATGRVQIDTLQRIVASLDGKLVVSAVFPDGTERRVAFNEAH